MQAPSHDSQNSSSSSSRSKMRDHQGRPSKAVMLPPDAKLMEEGPGMPDPSAKDMQVDLVGGRVPVTSRKRQKWPYPVKNPKPPYAKMYFSSCKNSPLPSPGEVLLRVSMSLF